MDKNEYKSIRKQIGTQSEVAKILNVDVTTISKRERGVIPISKESEFAIIHIHNTNCTA